MRSSLIVLALVGATALIGCSNDETPDVPLSISATYHLRSIDGAPLPITDAGGTIDSGHVIRLAGDTVKVDQYSSTPPFGGAPGTIAIESGTWRATEFSNEIVLIPVLAQVIDTAFISGDTLTLHSHSGGTRHVDVFVAP